MNEWICFWVTAAAIAAALALATAGVIGNCRFGSAVNRIHAAGIGDTMSFLLVTAGLAVSAPSASVGAKLFLPLVFLWITSPISSHFLALMEYRNGYVRCGRTAKN